MAFCKKGKIKTYRAHRILIRQRNFESLANEILFSKEDLPQSVKEKAYNEIARERYHNVMCFYLNRDVQLREAGFVIQPHLPWIVATLDGLISDASNNNDAIGILRIVCPRSLRNSDIEDILSDPNFFIEENKGVIVLKRNHHEEHFTNYQLQIGLCGASFCDIAVFVFNGMIIMQICFKKDVFVELIIRSTAFIKKFYYLNLRWTLKRRKESRKYK